MAPVHAGTVRYLREKGLWGPANERRQAFYTAIQDAYAVAWEAALARADRNGVKVAGDNPAWAELWQKLRIESGLPDLKLLDDSEITRGLSRFGPAVKPDKKRT
jgi:hypothetical protein